MMAMVTQFVPALELNAKFYDQVVGPALTHWPHAAARLGWGSEVLGFDTERSTDHGWGPQLVVFVDQGDVEAVRQAVEQALPDVFAGWPVRYGWDDHPVRHQVSVSTLRSWLTDQLGVDVMAGMTSVDWLVIPQQKLLEATRGAVYHDHHGTLAKIRAELDWYPDAVWRWMLAAQWRRLAQEEAFVGRTADVGDELGSRLVAARLAREVMRLWFLQSRAYWPYSKWFGSAFVQLPQASDLQTALEAALAAETYAQRETGLAAAYELVSKRHNDLCLTDPVDPTVRPYYGRPFRVLMSERLVEACLAGVTDPNLLALPLVGSIDQVADSTDLLSYPDRVQRLRALYAR
jgi:hypothetical protein